MRSMLENIVHRLINFEPRKTSIDATQLEDRVMLSAAPMVDVVTNPAASTTPDELSQYAITAQVTAPVDSDNSNEFRYSELASENDIRQTDRAQPAVRLELVFVDTGAADYQQLVDDLLANADSTREFEVYLLDANRDGIEQISDLLGGYENVDAVHLISHGTDGYVKLGNTWLNFGNLDGFAGEIAGWNNALKADADLLIYGCNLAASQNGKALAEALGALCNCQVAASVDDTGNAQLGGDWELEFATGIVETKIALSSNFQDTWLGVLAYQTYRDEFNSISFSGSNGTQSWSGSAWQEIGESNGAGSGQVVVKSVLGEQGLQIQQSGRGALRELNLLGATSAYLSFDYARVNLSSATDIIVLEISGNGGVSWTEIDRWQGAANDTALRFAGYDISSYAASNTQLRFVNSGLTSSESIFIDNLQIAYATSLLTAQNEFLINSTTVNSQETSAEDRGSQQAVSMASDGSYVVVWTSANQDGSGLGVYAQRFAASGSALTAEFRVNQTTTNDQQWARVASAADGSFVVTWTSNQGASAEDIYFRRFAADGTALTGETLVNTTTSGTQKNSVISMNETTGGFVIAWQGNGNQSGEVDVAGIFGQRFSNVGSALGGEFRVNATTANTQYDTAISVNDNGAFVVTWDDSAGYHFQRFDNSGTEQGGQVTVDGSVSAGNGAVAMNNDGSFVTIWRATLFDLGVYARRYDSSGTPLAPASVVNTMIFGDQTNPSIAMDSSGSYLIVWEGSGAGDTDGIYGRKFNSAGVAVGGEFAINSTKTGVQNKTSVAMLDINNFVVVWSGNGDQAGQVDSSGVFARQYGTAAANSPPTDIAPNSFSVDENINTSGGYSVGTLLTTDPDVGETFVYTIVGGADQARFTIGGAGNDELILTDGILDFETKASYLVTVRVTDSTLNTYSETVTVNVNNLNDAPVITSNGSGSSTTISVSENTTAVTVVTATDADLPAQTLTYTISGGADAAKFTINSSTGVLSFVAAPNFEAPTDAGANNVYDVTVQISDGSLIDTQAISVAVTNNASGDVLIATQDTYIKSGSPTLNYGQSTSLIVDKSGGGIGNNRALLLFDLADIPTNVTITNAILVMQSTQNSGPLDINVYQVTQAWQEGSGNGSAGAANWTQKQTGVNWSAAGGDFANTVIATLNTGAIGQHTWDVTSLVADWQAANKVNYGVIIGSPNLGTGTVTYDSAEGAIAPQLVVTFDATNGPPIITSNGGGANATINVAENSTVVTTVTATDVNLPGQTLTYAISGGADAAKFVINSSTGLLTFVSAGNYESPTDVGTDNIYDVIVQVSDGIATDIQAIAITVTPVNDNTPVITSNGGAAMAAINVAENTTAVTSVTATDADLPAQSLTYSITGGADAAKFAINGSTGALSFIVAPNFETPSDVGINNVYDVIVQVSDGTLTDTQSIAITVTPVNDNTPVISSNGGAATAAISVAENTTAVTTVTATDADLPAQSLTYSISGGVDAAKFTINGTTGVLSFIVAPNFETPSDVGINNVYDIIVQVSDGTLTDTQSIAISVTPVNDNTPVITSNGGAATAAVNVAENTTAATTITATDADLPAQSLTYSISGGVDATKFTINGTTGVLSFIIAPNFETPSDVGTNNVYDVIVQVSDGTLTDTQSIAITVTPANDNTPIITSNGGAATAAINVAENTTSVATVAATDADLPAQSLTYSISGGVDATKFTINGTTGVLSFIVAQDYETPSDVGTNNVYDIIVQVSDGTLTDTQSIAISVTPVNDNTPVITSNGGAATAAVNVAENTTAATTITATDADLPAQSLTYSISGGVDATKFTINGTTGVLSFIIAPNFETPSDVGINNVYDVIVQISDGTLTDTQSIAITVTPVNDNTPIITSNGGAATAAVNVAENTTAVTTVTATDADLPAQSLTYSISGGVDATTFTINGTTGALSFIVAPNFETPSDVGINNVYDVIVQISDGTLTDTQSLAITVTPVNDNTPLITSNGGAATAAVNVAENTTAATTITATDADLPAQSLTYSISGGVDATKFTINGTTGALSFIVAPNFDTPSDVGINNVYDIIVQVSDGTLTDTQSIAITVTAANDNTPVITSNGGAATAAVNVAENTTAVTTVTATDADLPAQLLTYSISGGVDATKFTINGSTGALSFIVAPNFETPSDVGINNVYDIIVQVSDGLLTDLQVFSITVTPVNESPMVAVNTGTIINQGSTSNIITTALLNAADPDDIGTGLTYTITAGPINGTLLRSGVATTTFTQDDINNNRVTYDHNGSETTVDSFTFSLADGGENGSLPANGIFTFVISPANNNRPVFTSPASTSVNENTTFAQTVRATDADLPAQMVTYSISGGSDAARFIIDGATGNLSFLATPDFESPSDTDTNNSYVVEITADDNRGSSTAQLILVTVQNVNESPVISSAALASVAENTTFVVNVVATDGDNDLLTYSIIGGSDASLFAINTVTGTLSFSTPPNFEAPIDANLDNVYQVRVRVADGNGGFVEQVLTVTAIDANDLPIGLDKSYSTESNQTLAVSGPGILAGDTDEDLDLLTVSLLSGPLNGSLTLNTDGSFTYAPNESFSGTDSFVCQVADGNGGTAVATVTLRINNVIRALLATSVPDNTTPPESQQTEDEPQSSPMKSSGTALPVSTANETPTLKGRSGSPTVAVFVPLTSTATVIAGDSTPSDSSFDFEPIARNDRIHRIARDMQRAATDNSLHAYDLPYDTGLLWDDLAELQDELKNHANIPFFMAGSAASASSALTVGYVLWTIRSGLLATSLLAQMPAWRLVDPLVVLDYLDEESGKPNASGKKDQDESLASMLDNEASEPQNEIEELAETTDLNV